MAGRQSARKQHFKASFDAKKLWTTSEATATRTATAPLAARGPRRRFKAPKPVTERGPPAEQEDHEEGKGARLEADSIVAHGGAYRLIGAERAGLPVFFSHSCKVDFSTNIRKFYGGLNNIISVLGKKRNEISFVHLVKTYCVPSLLYGCEVWNLSCAEYRHLNVVWNNTFRKKFNCCWRETTRQLLFYCEVLLPMAYLVDQQTITFYKRLQSSENIVLRVQGRLKHDAIVACFSK